MRQFENEEQKCDYMLNSPVKKLLVSLAVPTIMSMLVTSFYNMADTFFVGKIGTSATAGVGVIFSLMSIIQAVGFFFGHGSGNFISRALGSQHVEQAQTMASVGFFSCFFVAILVSILGQIFIDPLMWLLGSTETIFPYAKDYARMILIGMPFMASSLVLNNQLRFQGSSFFAMVGIVSGAVINIVLDPIFIFVLDMGVKGAGLATIISQFISFCILFINSRKNANIPIKIKNYKPSLYFLKTIAQGGLPSLARQGINAISVAILNLIAGGYSDAAIAGISIVSRINMFVISAFIGFGQGFQPICGFSYGAKKYSRIKEAYDFCNKVSFFALLGLAIICFTFAPTLIGFFRDDPQVIAVGAKTLRFQCLALPFVGYSILAGMMLQTVNKTVPATILGSARSGILLIPLLLILNMTLGLLGIQMAQMFADLACLILSYPLAKSFFKEIQVN